MATGTVEQIHVAATDDGPVQAQPQIEARAGQGLVGEYHFGRDRDDVTLIEAERVERLATEHGLELEPAQTWRNVTTRGLDLGDLIGRRFRLGDAVCEGIERCEPCAKLARRTDRRVLKGLLHSGLSAKIVESGTIRVGDPVEALP